MTTPSNNGAPVVASVPWARQPSVPVKRATARNRNVIRDLPDWEPMPPGEILVRRRPLE